MGVFDRFKQVPTRTTTSDRASDENHCSFRVGIRGTGVIKSISPTGESAGDNDWVDMEIEMTLPSREPYLTTSRIMMPRAIAEKYVPGSQHIFTVDPADHNNFWLAE